MGMMQHLGQVYVPIMNALLMALCLIVVGAFKSSANIGKAYGEPRLKTISQFLQSSPLSSACSMIQGSVTIDASALLRDGHTKGGQRLGACQARCKNEAGLVRS